MKNNQSSPHYVRQKREKVEMQNILQNTVLNVGELLRIHQELCRVRITLKRASDIAQKFGYYTGGHWWNSVDTHIIDILSDIRRIISQSLLNEVTAENNE